ncbi:MAG TPA: GNAT family N-acetyltransferase [Gemmataceae bacterium]|nr:GNAT family N-acetyltransferase [Gemmataceae bacterium]
MTETDLPLGLRLTAQAGWNQAEADWRRFQRLQPDGCFVAECDGAAVGTAACFLFGPVAWLAMVLVDEAARGRGVGTALVRHGLAFADARGAQSVRLDATPLGRPIYERLGFVADCTWRRYEGVPPDLIDGPLVTTALQPWDWPDVLRLDRRVTGAAREPFLRRLHEERPDAFRVLRRQGTFLGFVAWRGGARADHIGPCLTVSELEGTDLLRDAFRCLAGRRVFIDIPEARKCLAVPFAEACGLTLQRPLLRMTRGRKVSEAIPLLWASSGPEKG